MLIPLPEKVGPSGFESPLYRRETAGHAARVGVLQYPKGGANNFYLTGYD